MPQEDTTPPFQSTYPELRMPEHGFVSTIPEHLLEGADPQLTWIMTEISKNTAATEFACRAVLEQNAHLRALNGKTFRNEKNVAEAKGSIDALNKKAEVMEPLMKPLSQFMNLWEYRWFRWVFYIAGFFLITYALPVYLTHPFDISKFFGP